MNFRHGIHKYYALISSFIDTLRVHIIVQIFFSTLSVLILRRSQQVRFALGSLEISKSVSLNVFTSTKAIDDNK